MTPTKKCGKRNPTDEFADALEKLSRAVDGDIRRDLHPTVSEIRSLATSDDGGPGMRMHMDRCAECREIARAVSGMSDSECRQPDVGPLAASLLVAWEELLQALRSPLGGKVAGAMAFKGIARTEPRRSNERPREDMTPPSSSDVDTGITATILELSFRQWKPASSIQVPIPKHLSPRNGRLVVVLVPVREQPGRLGPTSLRTDRKWGFLSAEFLSPGSLAQGDPPEPAHVTAPPRRGDYRVLVAYGSLASSFQLRLPSNELTARSAAAALHGGSWEFAYEIRLSGAPASGREARRK